MSDIPRKYPYLPEGRQIIYVPDSNEFMQAAKDQADNHATDRYVSTGAVVVSEGEIIGMAANQSTFHKDTSFHKKMAELHTKVCLRDVLGIPTGKHYWACPACVGHTGHAEHRAVHDTKRKGKNTDGADVYMYGHWWCCEPCWKQMISAGIKDVYLLENSWEIFDV